MTETIDIDDAGKPSKGSSMGLCVVTCLLMAMALYLMFWHRPVESGAALVQRMVFVYVPAIWVSGVAFVLLMLTSVGYLLTTQDVWYSRASAMAEAGMLFCSVTLVAAALRGKAMTGRWLNGDMVPAMILVLWGLLAAYLSLRRYAATQAARKWLTGFGVLTCFCVPVIYSGLRRILPTQSAETVARQYADSGFEIVLALAVSMLAFFFLFWYLVQHRVSLDAMEAELEQLRQTILGQSWQTNDLLVENQNFIIEGYSFTENHQHE